MTTSPPLIQANAITVYFDDTVVFKGFNASVTAGEHLALIGENGSGKSTLLKLFAGDSRLSQIPLEGRPNNGTIQWNFTGENECSVLVAKEHVRLVSPGQQNTYIRQGWRISGEEIILSGLHNTPLLYSTATEEEQAYAHELARKAQVEHLLLMLAPDMSQGQLRAMLILRAIITHPQLLLLDEPMEGLDTQAKSLLADLMRMAAEQGCTLIVTAHRQEDIPSWITRFCQISPEKLLPIPSFPKEPKGWNNDHNQALFDRLFPLLSLTQAGSIAQEAEITEPANQGGKLIPAAIQKAVQKKKSTTLIDQGTTSAPSTKDTPSPDIEMVPLVALDKVDVYIERKHILTSIDWHIHKGEHWLLLGENGSGKSTLLRLLHGEEFAAWGGSLRWFGQKNLPLTELQKRVGYVSDRLHSLYTYDMSAYDVVLSGADGSIGIYRDLNEEELARAELLMEYFQLQPFAKSPFHSLSSGQGRRVLLARALVGSPKVLLLDEPFSGLDAYNRALWLHTLPLLAERGISIVFVSHHQGEYGDFFTHTLTLANGSITKKEKLAR